jgi:hypothetical protein
MRCRRKPHFRRLGMGRAGRANRSARYQSRSARRQSDPPWRPLRQCARGCIPPSAFPSGPSRDPGAQKPLEALPYPVLIGLSRVCKAASRLAARGGSGGAKMPFKLPILASRASGCGGTACTPRAERYRPLFAPGVSGSRITKPAPCRTTLIQPGMPYVARPILARSVAVTQHLTQVAQGKVICQCNGPHEFPHAQPVSGVQQQFFPAHPRFLPQCYALRGGKKTLRSFGSKVTMFWYACRR